MYDSWGTAALVLTALVVAAPSFAAGDANLFLGEISTDDDAADAAGLDTMPQYGVLVNLQFEWPVVLALDLMDASDDSCVTLSGASPTTFDTSLDTVQFAVGVRKLWGEKLRPYVGGGIAWVELDAKQTETVELTPGVMVTDLIIDDSGSSLGFWLDGGFVYVLGRHVNLGVDVRYTDASVDLQPEGNVGKVSIDAGGTQYGLLVGYHW